MNKEYVLWNLREAHQQLSRIIQSIETAGADEPPEFSIDMQLLYNHLNIAWNARDTTPAEASECSEEDFQKWRQFPDDIDMAG